MTTTPPFYVTFPVQATWIPDLTQLSDSGQVILQTAGQALDYFNLGTDYERRVLTQGQITPLNPDDSVAAQLVVSLTGVHLGRAGEQDWQFYKGDLGMYSQRVLQYSVQVARRWPVVTGGISPRMQEADDLLDASVQLWQDAWIVWSALLAMSLGGTSPGPAPIPQDNVLIGALVAESPAGGVAVVRTEVQVQV